MNIFESISSSINNIINYKIRSFLTILGIIIGISSVIIINFAGEGIRSYIFTKLDNFNKTVIQVDIKDERDNNVNLLLEDREYISKIKEVEYVSAFLEVRDKSIKLKNGVDIKKGNILGVDENYKEIENLNIIKGRSFNKNDIENRNNVALIEEKTCLELFGNIDIVGKKIEVIDVYDTEDIKFFTLIGVIENIKENSLIKSHLLFIPTTSAQEINIEKKEEKYIDYCFVKYSKENNSEEIMKNIETKLNKKYNTKDSFSCIDYYDDHKSFNSIFSGVKKFITFVASISLFVAGVGVMNIMLVTVTERTREIGIRKSLGATNFMIKLQFLIEASLLTSLGGILGGILGIISSYLVCNITSYLFKIEINSQVDFYLILKLIFLSYIVGVVFGVYPAAKAAKLDPVNALRYR